MGYFVFTANTPILIIWMSHVVVWLKSHSFGSVILLKLWEDFAPIYCRDLFFKQFLPVIWLKQWGCSSYSPQMAETPANSGQTMRPPTLQFIFGFLFPAPILVHVVYHLSVSEWMIHTPPMVSNTHIQFDPCWQFSVRGGWCNHFKGKNSEIITSVWLFPDQSHSCNTEPNPHTDSPHTVTWVNESESHLPKRWPWKGI